MLVDLYLVPGVLTKICWIDKRKLAVHVNLEEWLFAVGSRYARTKNPA